MMAISMITFLFVFLLLYGGMNFYVFFKAKSIFCLSATTQVLLIIALTLLVLAPVVIHVLERFWGETTTRVIAYTGYLWMAFIFLFFFLYLTFDIVQYILNFFQGTSANLPLSKIFFIIVFFASLILTIYGYFDAQNIRIKKIQMKMNPNFHKDMIRIVQISDLHIGMIIRGKRLEKITKAIEENRPDILVSTGDLLDGEPDNITPEAEKLAKIKTKYGKFAVTGNHEYYAGIKKSLDFTQRSGFEILQNQVKQVAGIYMIGFNDETDRRPIIRDDLAFPDCLTTDKSFVLLLKHRPIVRNDIPFHLQLSGHTHGGQIFPFMFLTRLFFPKHAGYYRLGKDKFLYVNSGAGTWGPPVRLFAPAEITVIDLLKDQDFKPNKGLNLPFNQKD